MFFGTGNRTVSISSRDSTLTEDAREEGENGRGAGKNTHISAPLLEILVENGRRTAGSVFLEKCGMTRPDRILVGSST